MKTLLKLLFIGIFTAMVWVTTWAQSHEPLFECLRRIPQDPWFIATLFDTYFAFLCFWLWVALRERNAVVSILWLLAIFILGNLAMSVYVLIRLFRLKPEEPVSAILQPAK